MTHTPDSADRPAPGPDRPDPASPPAPDLPGSAGASADPACIGVRWCLALLDGLLAGGLAALVLSPGSRSTPMVLAAQRRPGLPLTPILDERSAAFYALGLARASGRPAALLATSGSAPAHWLPAVVEASESGVPLVLLSADRPPELTGWGANQTVDQTRMFGPFVRAFHNPGPPLDAPSALHALVALGLRAAAVAGGVHPGPVHINLPLREPLVPRADCDPEPRHPSAIEARGDRPGTAAEVGRARGPLTRTATALAAPPLPPGLAADLPRYLRGRGLIYCGPDRPRPGFPEALWQAAAALGVPVLTDPLSEVRFGPVPPEATRIARYKTLVRNPAAARALRPDWVLRFGRAPISKTVLEWLPGIPTVLVDPEERWADPLHALALPGSLHLAADPRALCAAIWGLAADGTLGPADPHWTGAWTAAEARLADLAARYVAQAPWCEAQLIPDLLAAIPPGEGLLCANSLPIRQLETWAGAREAPLRLFANRGASGIDGQLSTLAGLNAAGVPTAGLLGDLSFLHDLSGLLLAGRLDRPVVVLNNGGGRIFDYLPQAGLPDFERLWRTPRPVDLGALAGTFGLAHRRVADAREWRAALADTCAGPAVEGAARPSLIEVAIDAERSLEVHLAFRRLVAAEPILG